VRAELSVTDGMPPPAGLPQGECITTVLPDGGLRIDRADPRILISTELIDMIADNPSPLARLDTTGCQTFIGALLKIDAANRQVVYRITGWLPRIRGFTAEWPD
jgi:hypothetical protein